ncbi:MAG: carbohydrate porin [Methylacidiphilales bacterium]|nr:carbohydrate porin [Candidatus Methylacidiphilales bacterium]
MRIEGCSKAFYGSGRKKLPAFLLSFLFAASFILAPAHGDSITDEFGVGFLPPRPPLRSESGGYLKQDNLTWNWWGIRDKMEDRGIVFNGSYTSEVQANVQGGIKTGSIYDGQLVLGLELQTEKLTGGSWPGGVFRVNADYVHGGSITGNDVGDLLGASNIGPTSDEWSVDFYYEQSLFEKKLVLTLGYMGPGNNFAGNDVSWIFSNSAFGWPEIIGGRAQQGPYSNSVPGFVIHYAPIDEFYFQAGAYAGTQEAVPVNAPPSNGIDIAINEDQGALGLMEVGYKLNQGQGDKGLPGTYRLGGWYRTRDTDTSRTGPSVSQFIGLSNAFGPPTGTFADYTALVNRNLNHDDHVGLYFSADQMVYRQPKSDDRGLTLFWRVGDNESGTTQFDFYTDGGLSYKGLIPGRQDDVLAVGAAYAGISDNTTDYQQGLKQIFPRFNPIQDYEAVVEGTYSLSLTPFWSLQPDIQWILHPGGSDQNNNALVVGFRNTLYF